MVVIFECKVKAVLNHPELPLFSNLAFFYKNAKISIYSPSSDRWIFFFYKCIYLVCCYVIQPKRKIARYQSMLSEETKDRLRDEIIQWTSVAERKYKDRL